MIYILISTAMVITCGAIGILARANYINTQKHETDIQYLIEEWHAIWDKINQQEEILKKYGFVDEFLKNLENEVQRQKQITEENNNNES